MGDKPSDNKDDIQKNKTVSWNLSLYSELIFHAYLFVCSYIIKFWLQLSYS